MNLLITGAWAEAEKYIAEIEKIGHKVVFMQWEKDELPCRYEWVEGVICNALFLYHPIISFPNLRYIQLTSAGFDRVDLDYIQDHNIIIHNARGVYSIPMAEYAVTGVLSLYKRVFEFHEQQERHEWKKIREIRELSGKRVVIVGCGDVGRECARKFKAFDCKIIGVNRTVRQINCFDIVVSLDKLENELKEADVVVVTIALSETTKGLVKAKHLKPDGVLINISRGEVVDFESSQCELILDVFEEEPVEPENQLWNRTNIITPHNSFAGEGNGMRLWKMIRENLSSDKL